MVRPINAKYIVNLILMFSILSVICNKFDFQLFELKKPMLINIYLYMHVYSFSEAT